MLTLITEDRYYDLMASFKYNSDFEEVHDNWNKCFHYAMFKLNEDCNKSMVMSLFYYWEMDNWDALHLDQTEYKNYTKDELKRAFAGECNYICDRISYDRLFRAHWLFRQAWSEFDEAEIIERIG